APGCGARAAWPTSSCEASSIVHERASAGGAQAPRRRAARTSTDIGETLAMGGRIAGENRHRLAAIRVRIDRKQRSATFGGENPAGLDNDDRGARNVPERRAVIVDERQRTRGHVAELERGRAEAAQPVLS